MFVYLQDIVCVRYWSRRVLYLKPKAASAAAFHSFYSDLHLIGTPVC